MKTATRFLVCLGLSLLAAVVCILWLALEDRPLVSGEVGLSRERVERARRILAAHDPRRAGAGERRQIVIGEEDLGLLMTYGTARFLGGSADVRLSRGVAIVRATIDAGGTPFGRYLNLQASLSDTAGLPRLDHWRVGAVPLPASLGVWLLETAIADRIGPDAAGVIGAIERIRFADRRIAATYRWSDEIAARVRAAAYPPAELARLRWYYEKLAGLSRTLASRPAVPLGEVLAALLIEASGRPSGSDPVKENRALLLALGLHAAGRGPTVIAPDARGWPKPLWVRLTLNGREDLAQHFAVSAALAANGGGAIADAIGLYKELVDAQGGSGFSFTDLAADRAGTRFGQLATASRTSASALQARAGAGMEDGSLIPRTDDLPEFLHQSEFTARFGGVGGEGYNRLKEDIERRIAALALYR